MTARRQQLMLEQANALVRWAVTRLQHLQLDYGVTVLVHAARPSSADPFVALQTTLPNRRASRAVISQALLGSLLADGVTPDNVADVALRELVDFEGTAAPPPQPEPGT